MREREREREREIERVEDRKREIGIERNKREREEEAAIKNNYIVNLTRWNGLEESKTKDIANASNIRKNDPKSLIRADFL